MRFFKFRTDELFNELLILKKKQLIFIEIYFFYNIKNLVKFRHVFIIFKL